MKNKLEETIRNVIREFAEDFANTPIIEIRKNEQDPRAPQKGEASYHVNYQINDIEIEGDLRPHHTGRSVEYGFEPGYFTDSASEEYWDNNWETVEDQIREKFYSQIY